MRHNKPRASLPRRQFLAGLAGAGATGAMLVAYAKSNNVAYFKSNVAASAEPTVIPVADGIVYLTFDDGPTPGYTNEILVHLKAAGARATFFQVGERMIGNESLVKRILADGHQIGTHSWSHPDFTQLGQPSPTLAQFGVDTQEQILKARSLQLAYTEGYNSGLFRYPHFHRTNYGDFVLGQNGMIPIYADIAPLDYDLNVSDQTIINEIVANVHDSAVVDLHDGDGAQPIHRPAPSYLPELLTLLKKAGYRFETLNANNLPAAAITVTRQPE